MENKKVKCIKNGVTGECYDIVDKNAQDRLAVVEDSLSKITGTDAGYLVTDEELQEAISSFVTEDELQEAISSFVTEDELQGPQTLYQQTLRMPSLNMSGSDISLGLKVLLRQPNALTGAELVSLLKDKGYTSQSNYYPATGTITTRYGNYYEMSSIYGVCVVGSQLYLCYKGFRITFASSEDYTITNIETKASVGYSLNANSLNSYICEV